MNGTHYIVRIQLLKVEAEGPPQQTALHSFLSLSETEATALFNDLLRQMPIEDPF